MTKLLFGLVGMKHRGTVALVASLPNGEPLVLKREPTNDYDVNAVQVWARGQHVGYVKAQQNRPLAMAMDAAARVAKVNVIALDQPAKLAIDGGRWPLIEVES